MIEIENGVPLPVKGNGGGGRSHTKYPFASLAVGDSFFVPVMPGKTLAHIQRSLSGCIGYHTKKTGARFTSRRVEGGVRFWRTA
jgi:hypothetical protein